MNPFEKSINPHAKGYIRSWSYEDKDTRELVTISQVKKLENLLVSNLPAY
jgi:hypothetical protein